MHSTIPQCARKRVIHFGPVKIIDETINYENKMRLILIYPRQIETFNLKNNILLQFWRDCWSSIHPYHLFISIYKHINTFEHTISLNQCMVWLSCRSVSQGDNWYRHAIMLQCLTNTNLLSVLNYHLTQFVEMS